MESSIAVAVPCCFDPVKTHSTASAPATPQSGTDTLWSRHDGCRTLPHKASVSSFHVTNSSVILVDTFIYWLIFVQQVIKFNKKKTEKGLVSKYAFEITWTFKNDCCGWSGIGLQNLIVLHVVALTTIARRCSRSPPVVPGWVTRVWL